MGAYSATRQSRRLVLSSSSETYRGRPRLGRDSACGRRLQRATGDMGWGDAKSAAERVV